MEKSDDDEQKALFVEAFGDREKFFNVSVKEIEKAEEIIEKHKDRRNSENQFREGEEEPIGDEENIPESQEDKIDTLLDLFKDKDLVSLSKYIKVFNQGNKQILGIAHAKLNADFDQAFKKIKIKSDEEGVKHVKSFTNPKSSQMSGSGSMKATCCKIFYLGTFSKDFREKLVNLFNMELIESITDDDANNDDIATSQDYPMYSQSRTGKTLRVCSCCKFMSREDEVFEEHMKVHAKCIVCGLFFKNENEMFSHFKAFHAKVNCTECGKEILETNLTKHMNGHKIEKGYSSVVNKGKVRATRKKSEKNDETKETKVTGYRLFAKLKREEIKNRNPEATPQEIMATLNAEWNMEKLAGRKDYWDKRANTAGDATKDRSNEFHKYQKCQLCGLMIINLNAHMLRSHKDVSEEAVTIAEPASENVLVVEEVELDVASENNEENLIEETEIESTEEVVTVEQFEPELVTDSTVTEEVVTVGNDVSEFITEQSFKIGDILMVQRKTLHWPCKVIEVVSNKTYKVMGFDKNNTTEIKHDKYLLPFTTDAAVCEGRGAAWIKSWKSAKAEFERK